ncbi:glycoside hydrolase family 25 protein [Ruminococcaceae bacterium OttesenSCG-928-I18]|nr:glycoside hydrolase family 25 protein [Ruminococcaceae bacterium OttesenSCG-928-I18]
MDRQKMVTQILLVLNIILLTALVAAGIHIAYTSSGPKPPAEQNVPVAPESEDAAEVMGAGNTEEQALQQWIDNMKALAQKHGVDAYFLQELFPENIVYSFRGQHIYAEVDESLPKHPYTWENLRQGENGVLQYAEEGGVQGIFGIDVSKYQGEIDWAKVKEAGVEFVMIRAGYRGYDTGQIVMDEYFESYLQGASEAGIPIGVYFFSQAISAEEAVEEAEFVLEAVEGYPIAYPIVFDMEEMETSPYRTENLTSEEITKIAIAFCNRVQEGGYTPMLYGNVSWFLARMDLHQLHEYDKWFAQYRPMPYYPYEFTIWQYTAKGSVDGIEGEVDMNLSFVDYAAD